MPERGWCLWITGLPGSGKSTIAHALSEDLKNEGLGVQILSSDMLREVVTPSPEYTEEERDIVYGSLVFVARMLTENGVNVIIDATGNRRRYRDKARAQIPRFIEAYIRCPLEVCIERESGRRGRTYHAPEDIYKRAFTGKSRTVPGIGVPYEEPLSPDVVVDSDKMNPEECGQKIFEAVSERFLV